ncbi:MAG: hypothetical protein ABEJ68_08900 [Halobacteriaceae archaeon]
MSLDDLESAVADATDALDDEPYLDDETRSELAMLLAGLDTDDHEELVRRAIHDFFQRTVETGKLDFHLRTEFDVTYDEYLSGMTYDEMAGGQGFSATEDGRDRYTF